MYIKVGACFSTLFSTLNKKRLLPVVCVATDCGKKYCRLGTGANKNSRIFDGCYVLKHGLKSITVKIE